MIPLLLYYLGLPFLAAFLVIRFIKRHGRRSVHPAVGSLVRGDPIGRRFYRVVRVRGGQAESLGDFETHEEAVERAFAARETGRGAGEKSSWLVVDDQGETLDLFDL